MNAIFTRVVIAEPAEGRGLWVVAHFRLDKFLTKPCPNVFLV